MSMLPMLMEKPSFGLRLKWYLQTTQGYLQRRSIKRRQLSMCTSRRSMMLGNNISAVEVTHISKHGFWLLLSDEELLVPFDQFPWFRKGTIEQISEVQWPSPDHLYWPSLDVDLSVESIRNPAAFPLVSSSTTAPHPPQ